MKTGIIIALALLIILQYQLWLGKAGMKKRHTLQTRIEQQQQENQQLQMRNRHLNAEVIDLKTGLDAVEGRARSELGMIKRGEVFYQIVK